ncbi:hypothetical protein EON63_24375 [archaeon]|nr:MAG: hypothetical protein EON63_24375 [archaeon]
MDFMMHGYGVEVFGNGEKYEGEFKTHKLHGMGKFYDADGHLVYEGRYEDGERVDGSEDGEGGQK